MSLLADLSLASRASLYALLALVLLFSFLLFVAQIRTLRVRPFQNPDGTSDDWKEQRVLYGIAWADLLLACPLSLVAITLVFVRPRL